jgi:hypothetical protein
MKPRRSISKRIQLEVWFRDNWTCRFCNEPVIFSPTLKLLNEISPNHGYYHRHNNERKMMKRFAKLWASVDHVEPHSRGGAHDKNNFATACWHCNNTLNNKTKKEGKPELLPINQKMLGMRWDGMASLYLKLNKSSDVWTRLIKEFEN